MPPPNRSPVEQARNNGRFCYFLAACFFLAVAGASAVAVVMLLGGDNNDDSSEPQTTANSLTAKPLSTPKASSSAPTPSLQTPSPTPLGGCNGLVNLCDQPVNEILFATMHNANSHAGVVAFVPNHNQDLLTALKAGVRGLNMDIGYCGNKELSLVHGFCALGYSDPVEVWTGILQFMLDHPFQVLIMPTQLNDDTGGVVALQDIYNVMKNQVVMDGTSMADLLYPHPGPDTPWPTLGELIASNQRILFFHYNGQEECSTVACPTGFHDWFAYADETQFEFDTVEQIVNETASSCRVTRGGEARDFFGVNMFLSTPSEAASRRLNSREVLMSHLASCQAAQSDNLRPNLVLVDFWSQGDVVATVRELNAAL